MADELKKELRHKPFIILDVQEGIKAAPEKIPFLVEGLLLEVGLSMVVAKPKTGKSVFAQQLSVAVAEEWEFLGGRTLQGDVLYLMLEGPKNSFFMHVNKMGYT